MLFDAPGEFERRHVKPKVGRTLIAGSYVTPGKEDRRALYDDVVGVDMRAGPGVDVVANLEVLDLGSFDHIECMSVLEHCRRPWMVAESLERMLKSDGTILVTVPFVWREHNHPSDYFRFTPAAIRSLFPRIEWQALMYGNHKLYSEGKVPTMKDADGLPFFGRTEVYGFGVKA